MLIPYGKLYNKDHMESKYGEEYISNCFRVKIEINVCHAYAIKRAVVRL